MANRYLVDNLVENVKLQTSLPTTSFLFSDDNIVRLMTIEQNSNVVPFIQSLRGDYFVVNDDITLVAGQDTYDIPTRSIGNKLRYVCYVDATGKEIECPRLAIEQVGQQYFGTSNIYFGHVILYDKIKLYNRTGGNTFNTSGFATLRLKYYRKPNDLVKAIESGIVTSVSGNQVVVGFVPASWEVGTKIDFISPDPIFRAVSDSNEITNISTNTITFSEDLNSNVAVGQYACEEGWTPIPQLPVELIDLLTECTNYQIYSSTGDTNGLTVSSGKIDVMKKALAAEYQPRNEGNLIKLFTNTTIFDY